jgi:hypothetical protein
VYLIGKQDETLRVFEKEKAGSFGMNDPAIWKGTGHHLRGR